MGEQFIGGVPCMLMRGGTSKGAYFLEGDLPPDPTAREGFLLHAMGSPDQRQIDGIGGASPLTSKVAIVEKSIRADADIDYLFVQVFVDQPLTSTAQNCGNILAGVGPFAIERGLVAAQSDETPVRIFMKNTNQIATALVPTPDGSVTYLGGTHIDGVPGTAAAIPITFADSAGSKCGALLPTGNAVDSIDGVACTLIDNGMPCVIVAASDFGLRGDEDPSDLDARPEFRARLEALRLKAGPMMNLGDVREASVPKMTLISAPKKGGAIQTRSFIPHSCHKGIGVLAAVTVATACLLPEGPAAALGHVPEVDQETGRVTLDVEHPTGATAAALTLDSTGAVVQAGVVRTARKLFDGQLF